MVDLVLDHPFRQNVDFRWVYQGLYKKAVVGDKECANTSSMSLSIERSGINVVLIPMMSFTKRLNSWTGVRICRRIVNNNSVATEKNSKCRELQASNMHDNMIEVSSDGEFDFEIVTSEGKPTFSFGIYWDTILTDSEEEEVEDLFASQGDTNQLI